MSGTSRIPFFGINRQYSNLREEILEAADTVYRSGQVLDGYYTDLFEKTMAHLTERKYAVAVGSGTQALIFASRSVDYGRAEVRNKILIPSVSFVATVNAVLEAGFDPVFCDVDPVTGLIDLNKIPVSADQLHAVMYVNLFGNIIDYDRLQHYKSLWAENDVFVIEDAAQSFGAYYRGVPSGKLGDISCLSFDPTKNLNNYGSGGMILTDDYDHYEFVRDVRSNGKFTDHTMSGTNSRMSESDSAQMLVKLKYFDQWQARRTQIAEYYRDQLAHVVGIADIDGRVEHAWSKFVIHVSDRGRLKVRLDDAGIETRIHYSEPLHLEPVSFVFGVEYNLGVLTGAEEFCKTTLSLPIYPELMDAEVEHIVDSVIKNID